MIPQTRSGEEARRPHAREKRSPAGSTYRHFSKKAANFVNSLTVPL
ncbi:hypothetical protein NLX67_11705 [Domibacillus sp. A3M-37]|nr:hypothetical protein [Domibacillus sp. A3M-37]MCP3763051.1 hypothetical protein [Domibacillus sp. A3M-37]